MPNEEMDQRKNEKFPERRTVHEAIKQMCAEGKQPPTNLFNDIGFR